jgi:hypothetical protein
LKDKREVEVKYKEDRTEKNRWTALDRVLFFRILIITQLDALISQIYFLNKTLHVSDRSSVNHQEFFFTVHTALVYIIQVCWHIPFLCVQWKTPDNGRKMCPKRAEFYYRNKFEKLLHLFGFIIRIYRYARSPERQILFLNKILWRGFMNTSQDLRIRHGISWPRQMESFMSFDYGRYIFVECDAA